MKSPKIKIAIVDDKPIFRQSLRSFIEKEPDLGVVAEAEANLSGIKVVEEHKPDVVLMKNNMPFTDGLEDTKMVISRLPDTRVIILSRQSEKNMTATLCRTWACYHLCRKCSSQEILAAIREGLPQG
jgi:two-component system response regulator DegU